MAKTPVIDAEGNQHSPVQVSFEDDSLDFYECRACLEPFPCTTVREQEQCPPPAEAVEAVAKNAFQKAEGIKCQRTIADGD